MDAVSNPVSFFKLSPFSVDTRPCYLTALATAILWFHIVLSRAISLLSIVNNTAENIFPQGWEGPQAGEGDQGPQTLSLAPHCEGPPSAHENGLEVGLWSKGPLEAG